MLGQRFFDFHKILLDKSGDGFKNYFAFAWQYKQEGGYWFDGMQYPYGDLLSFADGQPAITIVLVGLKKLGLDFSGHELVLVQGLPMLGLFLTAFFLHKILRAYQLPYWWTIPTVLVCMALSPQAYRFNAHYSLAYMFCFPSIWYVLIRSEKEGAKKWIGAIIISVLLLVYGFIHPYHLLIGCVFMLSYFLTKCVYRKFDWSYLFAGLAPIILYLTLNGFIDPMDDRVQNPWGAWYYKAEVGDLFPFFGWYKEYLTGIVDIRSGYREGYCYVGILLFAIPYLIYRRKEIHSYAELGGAGSKYYLIAACLSLLFGMGVHVLLTDHKIFEWLPTLQQFRSLGRFAWPYFYIAFVILSVMFYRSTIGFKSKSTAIALFVFVAIMWGVDANAYLKIFHDKMQKQESSNSLYTNTVVSDALAKTEYTVDDFQAILPLPVSMEGAEKIRPYRAYFPRMRGLPFAFQSGLPFIGAHMSRNSLSRILKQYQLCSSFYVDKSVVQDFNSKKDLLVLLSKEDSLLFTDFAERGIEIKQTKHMILYRMPIDSLVKINYIPEDSLASPSTSLFYSDFKEENEGGLKSSGFAFIDGERMLAEIDVDGKEGSKLVLSFWLRVDSDNSTTPAVNLFVKDGQNKQIKHIHYSDMDMKRCEVVDNWLQVKKEITLPKNSAKLIWKISSKQLAIDHALITELGQDKFWHRLDEGQIIYDHYIGFER